MSAKDKWIFSAVLIGFLLSIVLDNPSIFHVVALLYVIVFCNELYRFSQGKEVEGVLGKYLCRYERLFGKLPVVVLMSVVSLFAFVILVARLLIVS